VNPEISRRKRWKVSKRNKALRFILLLGLVSLLGDVVYEGVRGVAGPFLASLGASAAVVGAASGLGEFLGYGLRPLSGYLSDRWGGYWGLTLLGYLALLSLPLLCLVGSWQLAVLLLLLERMGKAVRTPPRDAMLSHATSRVGRGWGFGIHEALDQVGAVAGPLLVALLISVEGYRGAFSFLFLPALLLLFFLLLSWRLYPRPSLLESGRGIARVKRGFRLYLLFVVLSTSGFLTFPLLAYRLTSSFSDAEIPLLYALAMGTDALLALWAGRTYDRRGLSSLLLVPLLSLPIAPLAFLAGGKGGGLLAVVLWGASMGVQETVMRAAVGEMVPGGKRGTAYGLFSSLYGFSGFAGNTLMGLLYSSPELLVAFSLSAELLSLPAFLRLREGET
jgi:MFS family permease